jgi:hypothetical protein
MSLSVWSEYGDSDNTSWETIDIIFACIHHHASGMGMGSSLRMI